jgi:SAM-dependent methyltransferase
LVIFTRCERPRGESGSPPTTTNHEPGCAPRHFDWIEENYGQVGKHIGVEAFLPRPDELPGNVVWIDADIASPQGVGAVGSGTVDLAFSGQNLEHLWPEQVVAFLAEVNRTLRPGGYLVVDSPNRAIAAEYRWSMPEHTVEFTPDEAEFLLTSAGFEIATMKGLWLCRHRGQLLPLAPPGDFDGTLSVLRRMVLATSRPSDSFIWWAEARKVGEPDIPAMRDIVRKIFESNWEERVGRLNPSVGVLTRWSDGRAGIRVAKGKSGCAMSGPWMALPPGTFRFEVEIGWSNCSKRDTLLATLEVIVDGKVVGSTDLRGTEQSGGETTIDCAVSLSDTSFGVGVQLLSTGLAEIFAPLDLRVSPTPW